MPNRLKVAVTGAAGQIAYALLPKLASGSVFGFDRKLELCLLETNLGLPVLKGVEMELQDCAFSLLERVVVTDKAEVAFEGADWVLLIGARPRTEGMERSDLLRVNAPIFVEQGKAIAKYASSSAQVLVVGNPANTNCFIAQHYARKVPSLSFSALTRLDQNRGVSLLAKKAKVSVNEVKNVIIWGNHSTTQFPDIEYAKIRGKPAKEFISDHDWLRKDFIEEVQNRGAEVIKARGASSALSAAQAISDHLKSFMNKTEEGEWFSASVQSDGSYGVDEGLIFSFPLISKGAGKYEIVQGLYLSDFAQEKIKITLNELRKEQEMVRDLLI